MDRSKPLSGQHLRGAYCTYALKGEAGGNTSRIAPLELVKHWGFGTSYVSGGGGADEGTRFLDRVAKRQNAFSYTNKGTNGARSNAIVGTIRSNWVYNARAFVGLSIAWNDVANFGANGSQVSSRESLRAMLAHLSAQVQVPIMDAAFSFSAG